MQQGKISKDLALIWEANIIYHNPLTKSDFMEARSSGVKPNETWSANKFKEVAKNLSSDSINTRSGQDDSSDESFHSDQFDPPLCNMTFAYATTSSTDYQSKTFKGFRDNITNAKNNKFDNKINSQYQSREDRDKSDDRKALLSKISKERLQGAISKETRSCREQYDREKYYRENRDRSITPNKDQNIGSDRRDKNRTERSENNRFKTNDVST